MSNIGRGKIRADRIHAKLRSGAPVVDFSSDMAYGLVPGSTTIDGCRYAEHSDGRIVRVPRLSRKAWRALLRTSRHGR